MKVRPGDILRSRRVTFMARSLYLFMITHGNNKPSHKEIAKATGCSVAVIRKYLGELREAGWISWEMCVHVRWPHQAVRRTKYQFLYAGEDSGDSGYGYRGTGGQDVSQGSGEVEGQENYGQHA